MNMMKTLIATGVLATITSSAFAATEITWWHSMTGALGERVNALADDFNKTQGDYKIVPVYKGTYDESMSAAIAAYRAGNAPAILQVFEVGTATMIYAKGAVKPYKAEESRALYMPGGRPLLARAPTARAPSTKSSTLTLIT